MIETFREEQTQQNKIIGATLRQRRVGNKHIEKCANSNQLSNQLMN